MHQLTSLHCYDCQQKRQNLLQMVQTYTCTYKGIPGAYECPRAKALWQFMGFWVYFTQKNSFYTRNLNEKNIPCYWCWDMCSCGSQTGVELCSGQTYHADQLPAIELLQFAGQTPLHHLQETLAVPSITYWSTNVELQRSLHIHR